MSDQSAFKNTLCWGVANWISQLYRRAVSLQGRPTSCRLTTDDPSCTGSRPGRVVGVGPMTEICLSMSWSVVVDELETGCDVQ